MSSLVTKLISNGQHISVSSLLIKLILNDFFQIYISDLIKKLISKGVLATCLFQQYSNKLDIE